MKTILAVVGSCGLFAATTVLAQTAPAKPAPGAAAPAARPSYSVEDSTVRDLLDNPATKTILVKHPPDVDKDLASAPQPQ